MQQHPGCRLRHAGVLTTQDQEERFTPLFLILSTLVVTDKLIHCPEMEKHAD
jgi:hypothetical protein